MKKQSKWKPAWEGFMLFDQTIQTEKTGIQRFVEGAFLAALCFYVGCLVFGITKMPGHALYGFSQPLTSLILITVLLKAVFDRERWRSLIAGGILMLVYLLVYRSDGYWFLIPYGLLAIGTIGIEYRKLLKCQVLVVGGVVLVAMFGALCGVGENLVYVNASEVRSSFGMIYPTDFASALFYVILFFWMAWSKLPHWMSALLCLPFLYVARVYSVSDTCTICGGLFFLVLMGVSLVETLQKKKGIDFSKGKKYWDRLLVWAFPMCAVLMFGLMLLYALQTPVGIRINRLLSTRLSLACRSLAENGIKLFGTPITQVGNGGSTLRFSGYNFVDSTYPLILIRYGWVLFLLLGLCWMRTTWLAVKAGDYRLALGMGLIAFHSLSEQHFLEVNYNLLAFMPFALYSQKQESKQEEIRFGRRFRELFERTAFAVGTVFLLTIRLWTNWFRSACGWYRYTRGGDGFGFLLILFAGAIAFFLALTILLTVFQKSRKEEPRKLSSYMAGIGCLILLGLVGIGGYIFVGRMERDLENRMENEREAVELVCSSAEGMIFENEVPVLYHRRFPKISYATLAGEELCRYHNTTVLMPRWEEKHGFFVRGFLYTPISEETALYTNDPGVIDALRERGYLLTGFYPETIEIDPPVLMAPGVDLRAGKYRLSYSLKKTELTLEEDQATVFAFADDGKRIVKRGTVKSSEFDEEGNCKAQVSMFLLRDSMEVKFSAVSANGGMVQLMGLSYQQLPDYDTHVCYDQKWRLLEKSYFSLEGEPRSIASGEAICRYAYDERGRVIEEAYFDTAAEPVERVDGYARVCYRYDRLDRKIQWDYYGVDGEAVEKTGGYARLTAEYDANDQVVYRYYDKEGKFLFVRVPGACIGW